MARQLSWGALHRLWQMLLKGLQDVAVAPDPREAAEMALLRLIHAADLPDPAALWRRLSGEAGAAAPARRLKQGHGNNRGALPADLPALVKRLEQPASTAWRSSCTTRSGWSAIAPPELVLKPRGRSAATGRGRLAPS